MRKGVWPLFSTRGDIMEDRAKEKSERSANPVVPIVAGVVALLVAVATVVIMGTARKTKWAQDDKKPAQEEVAVDQQQIDAVPEVDPAESTPAQPEQTGVEVLDSLQGWWVSTENESEVDEQMPLAYVFEGEEFYALSGNGQGTEMNHTIADTDISRAELDGRSGWQIALGEWSLFVADDDAEQPLLQTDSATISLTRGEGDLA